MLNTLTADVFAPLLHEHFQLYPAVEPAAAIDLELAEVQVLGGAAAGAGRQPFALLFLAPDAGYVPQQIYPLVHPAVGRLELFLVPLGPLDGRMRYEAIFN